MRVAKKCEWRNAELPLTRDPRARFCNSECRYLGRRKATFSDAVRQKRSEQMKRLNERLDVQAKRAAFPASDRAPFKRPDIKRKSIEKQREMGFPTLIRWSGPTIPQKILFDQLPGAVMEFALLKSGKRNSLKIDIAIPSLKLAIEVDGLSHTKRREKERDVRKAQILEARGWTLLRFWDAEVISDPASVLARIKATMIVLQKAA